MPPWVPPTTTAPTTTASTTTQPNVFSDASNALKWGTTAAYNASTFKPTLITPGSMNINAYMNPYQQQVIDTTMNGLADQQARTMNDLDAQASAAGAFGGSRHGVAMGTTNAGYADAQAETLANLNAANYTQAANLGMTAAGANQNAELVGANLNLNAAGQLGNLSNLGFTQGMTINGQQAAYGAQQQAAAQQLIDAAKEQYSGFTGAPAQSLAALLAGMSGVPAGGGTSTTTSTPGATDFLSILLGLA